MLYHLLYPLHAHAGLHWAQRPALRLDAHLAATLTALAICFLLGPWFIRRLRPKQIGEQIRADGPQTHKKKAGTPTMGGSLILFALVIPTLLWCDLTNRFVWVTLLVTLGYGAIGFVDDYLKLTRSKKGLPGRSKLVGQIRHRRASRAPISSTPICYDHRAASFALALPLVDFYKHPLTLAGALGATQRSASSSSSAPRTASTSPTGSTAWPSARSIVSAVDLRRARLGRRQPSSPASTSPSYLYSRTSTAPRSWPSSAPRWPASGIAFLWYNTYPAAVFMGDVGSLALGGALGMLAVSPRTSCARSSSTASSW